MMIVKILSLVYLFMVFIIHGDLIRDESQIHTFTNSNEVISSTNYCTNLYCSAKKRNVNEDSDEENNKSKDNAKSKDDSESNEGFEGSSNKEIDGESSEKVDGESSEKVNGESSEKVDGESSEKVDGEPNDQFDKKYKTFDDESSEEFNKELGEEDQKDNSEEDKKDNSEDHQDRNEDDLQKLPKNETQTTTTTQLLENNTSKEDTQSDNVNTTVHDEPPQFLRGCVIIRWDDEATICFGALISHWHILTSAHCLIIHKTFEPRAAKRLSVRFQTKKRGKEGFNLKATRWFVPPDYTSKLNDIAILEVVEFVSFSEVVIPLGVRTDQNKTTGDLAQIKQSTCSILGWLIPSGNKVHIAKMNEFHDTDTSIDQSYTLIQGSLLHCPQMRQFGGKIICFHSKQDGVMLISGSPLICNDEVVGVAMSRTSFPTGVIQITIFTMVSSYVSFITESMATKENDFEKSEVITNISKGSSLRLFTFKLYVTFIIIIIYF